jgi:hypothetical protein
MSAEKMAAMSVKKLLIAIELRAWLLGSTQQADNDPQIDEWQAEILRRMGEK